MTYCKGDKVVLKDNLVVGKVYDGFTFYEEMKELLSLPYLTVAYTSDVGYYTMKETEYTIAEKMISCKYEKGEDNMKYQEGDKVVIRKNLKVGEWYGNIQWWDNDEPLKEKDFIVIDAVDKDGDYVINGSQYINDEMISHKYEGKADNIGYQKGDRVVLRKDLRAGEVYGKDGWASEMKRLLDTPYVTISLVLSEGYYEIENTSYKVTDEMISHKYKEPERIMKYREGDKVVLKENLVNGEMYGGCYWEPWVKPTTDQGYVTIKEVSDRYYRIEESIYAYTDEMISHKYEESEPKYVWHCKDKNSTYVLTNEGFFKVSSETTYEKILNGDFSSYLLTEEEAKKTIFYPILKKHTPPPKEKLYYVYTRGNVGNIHLNLFLEDDTYYFGSKDESPRHRTKFTEEEADKVIGNSTVLYKKEVE